MPRSVPRSLPLYRSALLRPRAGRTYPCGTALLVLQSLRREIWDAAATFYLWQAFQAACAVPGLLLSEALTFFFPVNLLILSRNFSSQHYLLFLVIFLADKALGWASRNLWARLCARICENANGINGWLGCRRASISAIYRLEGNFVPFVETFSN